jgi:hypothetical protein
MKNLLAKFKFGEANLRFLYSQPYFSSFFFVKLYEAGLLAIHVFKFLY